MKAYEDADGDIQHAIHWLGKRLPHGTKLYAHPPAAPTPATEATEPVALPNHAWNVSGLKTYCRKCGVVAIGNDLSRYGKCAVSSSDEAVAQGGGVDDASLEAIIEESSGEWRDDEFRVTGSDLMAMLRKAALLAAAPAIAKQGEGE